MKKIISIVIALVLVLALITACGGGAAPPASEPAEPAPAPAAESSSDAASSGATVDGRPEFAFGPTGGRSEADYQFGFSFGGVAAFADPIPPMANLAAGELGIPEVKVMTPQNWEQNEQNQMLDGLIAAGCTSIFMMPSEATAANEQITKMVNAGIDVVCVGCPPNGDTLATLTLCTDTYQAAYDGTIACIEEMGGAGNIVVLSGDLNDSNTKKRFDGAEAAAANYPDVEIIQKIGDIENPEASMTAINNLFAARAGDISGIVATTYETATSLGTIMLQDTAGDYAHIVAVGTDTDSKVIEAILTGKMLGTMTQSPWAMGYVSMYTLKMLKDGWKLKSGEHQVFNTGASLVKKAEAENYDAMAKEAAIRMVDTWAANFDPPS